MADGTSTKKPIKRAHQVGTPAKVENATMPPGIDEDELDAAASAGSVSLFDMLRETIQQTNQEAQDEEFAVSVPMRPDMKLQFDTDIDFDTFQMWQRKCEDKKRKETNFLKFALIVMSHKTTGILLKGQVVTTPSGDTMTLTSPEFHDMLGVSIGGTGAAIRKTFMKDGHCIQALRLIVEKAGYSLEGDVVEADDEDGPLEV